MTHIYIVLKLLLFKIIKLVTSLPLPLLEIGLLLASGVVILLHLLHLDFQWKKCGIYQPLSYYYTYYICFIFIFIIKSYLSVVHSSHMLLAFFALFPYFYEQSLEIPIKISTSKSIHLNSRTHLVNTLNFRF